MADQLVLIAQFFRFDGWLINIENSLSVSTPALGTWPASPCAPRGPSAMLLSLTRLGPCYRSASCIPARASSNLQPLCLFTGRWAFSSVMSRNLAWLSFASLVPSRRPCLPPLSLLCLGYMCDFLFMVPSLFIGFYLLLIAESMSFLLQKERKVGPLAGPSARQLWGRGASGTRTCLPLGLSVLSVRDRGAPHERPLWASRRVCLYASLQLAAVGNVPHFLQYLTSQLHQQIPGGLVLWYDSVVSSGQLKWQNELNEQNR